MKLEIGDILEFEGAKSYAAEKGARAIYKGTYNASDEEFIRVEWIRDGKDHDQDDGGYFFSQFTKVEEVSFEKENRIFEYKEIKKEKVMKVDFKAGKERVVQRLITFIEDFEQDMLGDIKIIVNSDRENKTEQINEILDTIKTHKGFTEDAIARLEKAYSLKDILLAMRNTVFEEDEATILQAFLDVDSVTIV
jgi:hypothetical protein